jgi:iron(III) transport system ATP-binding protein
MTEVRLERLGKRFGQTRALADIDLTIAAGELFFLLGPSGCGKSTLLRLIAGLHEPSEGKILFNGRDVTGLGTDQRNAVMCFQSYALWPHMTVRENVRFGLGVRKVERSEQQRRVEEVLKLVRLEGLADRKPNQLPGGQQQRVALARALAVRPDCLLLDEPLSNLDAKLRLEMRVEIRRICKEAGFTTIYVTHDQKEALSVADRIAVLKDGRLEQVGTPGELYHRPTNSFVAVFIGQTNLWRGTVVGREDGVVRVATKAGEIVARGDGGAETNGEVVVSVRPEQMRIVGSEKWEVGSEEGKKANRMVGKVVESTFLGEASEHVMEVNGERVRVVRTPPIFEPPGEMAVEFAAEDVVVLAH